ncbi:MAG: type II secretion system protein [Phycisphaerales bacterium]
MRSDRRERGAFTLVELLVVIAIIALLVSILLPSLREARQNARQKQNFANLKQFGTSTQSYSADFQDRIWAFTWRAPSPPTNRVNFVTEFGDLVNVNEDVAAAASQAVDIIRRRSQPQWINFPRQAAWIPHVYYSHLVLMDYLAARLPEPMIHSPFDRTRGAWQADVFPSPQAAAARHLGTLTPRWLYSSSYETSPSSYAPPKFTPQGGSLRQSGTAFGTYVYNHGNQSYRLGNLRLADVQFASQKAHMWESINRLGKKDLIFLEPQCAITLVAFDGSVSVVKSSDMSFGGYLNSNNTVTRQTIVYPAAGYDARLGYPRSANSPMDLVSQARCRWTVGGIRGVDFGSSEPFR